MKKIICILLLLFATNVYSMGWLLLSDNNDREHILYGLPSNKGMLLYRKGYTLNYDLKKKVANWVSYHLDRDYLEKLVDRTDDFRLDSEIPTENRSLLSDYKKSGYDRGHFAPAAIFTRSKKLMSESFLLSNMAPQVGVGFNRGIWRVLEGKIREWALMEKDLYVVSGPIYLGEISYIGSSKVAVPSHFYTFLQSYSSCRF